MTPQAIWLAGLFASLSTVHLTSAWAVDPPDGVDFDKPILRALLGVFGWLVTVIVLIFAVRLDGALAPPLVAAALWAGGAALRRRVSLRRFYGLAGPLGLIGLACAVILFQMTFGDSFFGLPNVFPDR